MSPVRGALLAGTVTFYIIKEFVYSEHGVVNDFGIFVFVIFHKHGCYQHIAVTPGVPVVEHSAVVIAAAVPPPLVIGEKRIYYACFEFMAQTA